MRAVAGSITAVLLLAGTCGPAMADAELRYYLGARQMIDADTWKDGSVEDVRRQGTLGAGFFYREKGWPVAPIIELRFSRRARERFLGRVFGFDFTGRSEAKIRELGIGLSKSWGGGGRVKPFVGGGFTRVDAELEGQLIAVSGSSSFRSIATLKDDSMGIFLEGGALWRLAPVFALGVEARVVGLTKFDDVDTGSFSRIRADNGDANSYQLDLVLAWDWPDK